MFVNFCHLNLENLINFLPLTTTTDFHDDLMEELVKGIQKIFTDDHINTEDVRKGARGVQKQSKRLANVRAFRSTQVHAKFG